jgi:hypothetical protein
MREAALGGEHPDTLADGAGLAGVLLDLGRFDEAEDPLDRSLSFSRSATAARTTRWRSAFTASPALPTPAAT